MSVQDICNYYGIMTGRHMVTIPERWSLSAYISLPTTLNDLKGLLEEHESVTSMKVKMSVSLKQCRFPQRPIKTTAENVLSFLCTQSPSKSTTVSYLSSLPPCAPGGKQEANRCMPPSLHPACTPDTWSHLHSNLHNAASCFYSHERTPHSRPCWWHHFHMVVCTLDLWVVFPLKVIRLSQARFLPTSLSL